MTIRLPEDYESGFLSHFEELRVRLLYVLAAIAVGMTVGWVIYPTAYTLLSGPIIDSIHRHGGEVVILQPTEAFFTRMSYAGVLGCVLASPVILWQLWAFISPGLTARERRAVRPIVPMVCLLFVFGAAVAYWLLPKVMAFFLGFTPDGVTTLLDFKSSIHFPLQIMLAFGLGFQLPVVLLGLVALRVLSPALLLKHWRASVVLIGVLAAILAPGDPMSWFVVTLPLIVLYFGTILVAYRLYRGAAQAEEDKP